MIELFSWSVWTSSCLYEIGKGLKVQDQTELFWLEKRVIQGRLISPLLYNTVGEKIVREVETGLQERAGIVIGGRAIWNANNCQL